MRTPKFVSQAEAARRMGASDETIRRMVKDGRLPTPRKIGTHQAAPVRFDEHELEAAIAKLMRDRL